MNDKKFKYVFRTPGPKRSDNLFDYMKKTFYSIAWHWNWCISMKRNGIISGRCVLSYRHIIWDEEEEVEFHQTEATDTK